jgi:hypothetical protein
VAITQLNPLPLSGQRACDARTSSSQLSVLFGLLFVVSGDNLWAVILCRGLYDTVAFVRFANKSSKYSRLNEPVCSGE